MMMSDQPLSYWVAVARIGFQDDFSRLFDGLGISQAELARRVSVSEAYVSKFLNGTGGNYELETMAKWARAVGGIVQIRVINEDGEAVRVVGFDTARELDEKRNAAESSEPRVSAKILDFSAYAPAVSGARVERTTLGEPSKSHG